MRSKFLHKTFSVLLTAAMLFSFFCVGAFADYENTYINTGDQAADIIGVARSQIGYTEREDGATKYGEYLENPTVDWCGAFITWCANEADIPLSVIPLNGSSNGLKEFYEEHKAYYVSKGHGGTYTPKPGDIAFVSYTNDPENITHVGLVAGVTKDTLETVEGNYGNAVSAVQYVQDTERIVGFASPNYTVSTFRTGYYLARQELQMRSSPAASSKNSLLLTVPQDTPLRVSMVSDTWGYTYYDGHNGWIELGACTYMRPLESDEPAAPVPENSLYLVADISKFNEPDALDWETMQASGVKGVIIRIAGRGYGSAKALYEDTAFLTHYRKAAEAGMDIGVYFFSYALNIKQAREEAKMTVDILQKNNCELTMPVFIDIEDYSATYPADRQHEEAGKEVCTKVVNAFCDTVKEAGYYPGIYCNKFFAENLLDPSAFEDRAVWIAHYSMQCGYTGNVDLWQYTDSGRVDGYDGRLDLSYCYVDFPALINGSPNAEFGEHRANGTWVTQTKATCTSQGKRVQTCLDCGITLLAETTPRTAHKSSSRCILPAKTELKAGDVLSEKTIGKLIPSTSSQYKNYYRLFKNGTGMMLTYCKNCHAVIEVQYAYAQGAHANFTTETLAATCTQEGVKRTVCGDCGAVVAEKLTGYAKHTAGETVEERTTCTKPGTLNTVCSVCGETTSSRFVLPKKHTFDKGRITTEPTLTTPGEKTFRCRECGKHYKKTIPCLVFGDANCDNKVTAADARLALRASVELEELSAAGKIAADIDNTGTIESSDARSILRISVDLDSPVELYETYYP